MPKKRKRTLLVFALIVVALYVIIGIVPSLTGALTGTELVEFGELQLSDDAKCFIVRDETVYTAAASGDMDYYIEEGTQIKKGTDLFAFTPSGETADSEDDAEEASASDAQDDPAAEEENDTDGVSKYTKLIRSVKNNIAEDDGHISQRKGVISYHVDGYEDYFAVGELDKLSRQTTEALDIEPVDVKRQSCLKGEPIYKISNNSVWYILFWVDKEAISRYETGKKVTADLNGEKITATVDSIREDADGWQVILQTNRYYSRFAEDRMVEGTIINTDVSGLIVSNHCLTKENGQVGVYVRTKTGDYVFTPVQVKLSNGEQSVLTEGQFLDEEGNQVDTVEIYDEVLSDPANKDK